MAETTDDRGAVVIERSFDAPAELVWQMWTVPEHFKAWYGPNPTDYEAGTDHSLDDDVINTRTLTWTAGDSSTF